MKNGPLNIPADLLPKLERVTLSPKGLIHGRMQGKRRSRQLGSSLEFADYRVYTPGDDIRQLDWNVYARTGKPFIKLFLDEQELIVQLFIDHSASMGFGESDRIPSKLQFAKQLAACIGYIGLCAYDRVGASGIGSTASKRMPLLRGKGSFARLASFLNSLETAPGEQSEQNIVTSQHLPRHPGMSWVFSDFLLEKGPEPILNALLERGQHVVVVHILSPDELDPKLYGDLSLIDSERGTAKDVSISAPVLKAYQKERDRFIYSVQKACYERGIPYILVPTNQPLEKTVLGTFRKLKLLH